MIYTCDKCRFIFERVGEVGACPNCGKPSIREADEPERDKYKKNRSSAGNSNGDSNP